MIPFPKRIEQLGRPKAQKDCMLSTLAAVAALAAPTSTEVTVYNQGMGFIKEVRAAKLKKGTQSMLVENVAQLIDPTSVGFKCLSNPGSVGVLEQNYQFDLISPQSILAKSVGKKIRLTRAVGMQKETLTGTLLSSPTTVVNTGNGQEYSYNGLVIRADDGRIILSPQGEIDVMEMPEGLISTPSLIWELDSDKDQDAQIELSYLTQGMSWNANYVLTLDKDSTADVQGWVSLNNQSGMSFKDATLKLLAGEINTVQPPRAEFMAMAADSNVRRAKGGNQMAEESLFEYHLYTLQRPATVRNKENKQLSLLTGENVPVKKQIIFDSMAGYDGYYPDEGQVGMGQLSPLVKLKFVNDEKSNLGMPFPAGKIRIYSRDSKGSVQFLGEDMIKHTPKDEKISLNVGRSFDIRADRKRTNFTRIAAQRVRETFEIEVRNRKAVAETVFLYERHWGDWKITDKSDAFVKEDSSTAVFELKLKAGEVKTVSYTVETKW